MYRRIKTLRILLNRLQRYKNPFFAFSLLLLVYLKSAVFGLAPCPIAQVNSRVEDARRQKNGIQLWLASRDKDIVSSEKLISEALKLRSEWKAESLRKAINKYQEALLQYEAMNAALERVNTLRLIGETYCDLSENRKALSNFKRALQISQNIGDRKGEIQALNSIGLVCVDLGEAKKTLVCCLRAQALSRESGDGPGEAQALNNLGLGHFAMGEMPKAIDFFNQSLGLWKTLNDRRGEAEALNNKGYALHAQGDLQQALDCYNQSLYIWQSIGNLRGQAYTLTASGGIYSSVGEKQKALEVHTHAVQLFRTLGDRNGEAAALNGLGYAYEDLDSKERALESYLKAFKLYRVAGNRSYEALTMGYIGRIYYGMGQKRRALVQYSRRLSVSLAVGDLQMQANTLRYIGAILEATGARPRALSYYRKALSLSVKVNDKRLQAYTLNSLGYLYETRGDMQQAMAFYKEALPLIRAADDRRELILTLNNVARLEYKLGNFAEAIGKMEEVIDIVESLRTKIASHELRASYFASVQQHYELYIDLLMAMRNLQPSANYETTAFEASERARARILLESLDEAQVDIRKGANSDLLWQERMLLQEINFREEKLSRLLSNRAGAEQVTLVRDGLQEILLQYQDVQAQIRAGSPSYVLRTHPKPLTLSEIQQVLDPDTVLLEYSLGTERSFLWAVTQTSISAFELPARAEIESVARRVLMFMTTDQEVEESATGRSQSLRGKIEAQYRQHSLRLSKLLLPERVAAEWRNKRLLIVPDGLLMYIPFAALPTEDSEGGEISKIQNDPSTALPLVYNHEIVCLPSASTLGVLRRQFANRKPASKNIAIFADPVFEQDDARVKREGEAAGREERKNETTLAFPNAVQRDAKVSLPRLLSTRQEAEAILSLSSGGDNLLATGFKANLYSATGVEISNYQIIHFATHGLIDSEHPELSAIVLSLVSENGQPQNGFLRIHEICNMDLSADLVVLSACSTALGKSIRGEGIVGMTRAFMFAGATRVVSTLWKVDDDATTALMKRFYEYVLHKHLSPAAALRAAQIEMWQQKRWRHPYYWAAFTLQGEWK